MGVRCLFRREGPPHPVLSALAAAHDDDQRAHYPRTVVGLVEQGFKGSVVRLVHPDQGEHGHKGPCRRPPADRGRSRRLSRVEGVPPRLLGWPENKRSAGTSRSSGPSVCRSRLPADRPPRLTFRCGCFSRIVPQSVLAQTMGNDPDGTPGIDSAKPATFATSPRGFRRDESPGYSDLVYSVV